MIRVLLLSAVVCGCNGDEPVHTDVDTGDTDTGDTDTETPLRVELHATRITDTAGPVLVSNGVPFPPGAVTDVGQLAVFDGTQELSVHVQPLAQWPDGSVRSTLLQLERDAADFPATLTLVAGTPRSTTDRDGVPITWTLPSAVAFPTAAWMADSMVAGHQVPHGQVGWASDWEARSMVAYDDLKGDEDWVSDCRKDGYYSTSWAWYQLFVRTGDVRVFEWARRESVHYRDDQVVQTGEDAGTMDGRTEPRYRYQKAMAVDYLLTGDPKTVQVAKLMSDRVLDEWQPDRFFYEQSSERFWTERAAGFALLNPTVFGTLTQDKTTLDALKPRVDQLLATQDQWTSGGFIHNLYAHDPDECGIQGTYGGSPFMTGLLFEALIAYHDLTEDPRIVPSIVKAADWLWDSGWTGEGFRYQIGCESETGQASPDLDLLIAHGFAFAYFHTGEARFKERALTVFNHGVENAYVGTRKHYNQQYRSSASVVWYLENRAE